MKTRLFIDTNTILDLLVERYPFYIPMAKLATLAENGRVSLVASPISFATVNDYLSRFESS